MAAQGSVAAPPSGSMASSSLWAAVSQVATIGIQGIAALVILLLFGKGTDTDAVFAAYGLYGVIVLMCQTLRLTVVARLMEGASPWPAFDRFLGAGLSLVTAAIVVQLVLGEQIAALLTGDLGAAARDTARTTLDILCVARAVRARRRARGRGAGHPPRVPPQRAGLRARRRGGDRRAARARGRARNQGGAGRRGRRRRADRDRHGRPAVAARLPAGPRGVLARPRRPRIALVLLVGTVAPLLGQLNFVITLAFAAQLGAGAVTLYTGAFFAGAVMIAVTASAASLVLAAPIARSWDGDPATLLPHLRTIMRAGLVIIGPAVGVLGLVGDEVVEAVLGDSFDAGDADAIVAALMALTGLFVGMLAQQLPMLAAFAQSRYGAVAIAAAVGTAVHVAATAVATSLDDIAWLGVAASVSSLVTLTLMLGIIHGRGLPAALLIVARETAIVALVTVLAFGPVAALAAALGGGAWDFARRRDRAGAVRARPARALPGHAEVAMRMLAPVLPASLRPTTA